MGEHRGSPDSRPRKDVSSLWPLPASEVRARTPNLNHWLTTGFPGVLLGEYGQEDAYWDLLGYFQASQITSRYFSDSEEE